MVSVKIPTCNDSISDQSYIEFHKENVRLAEWQTIEVAVSSTMRLLHAAQQQCTITDDNPTKSPHSKATTSRLTRSQFPTLTDNKHLRWKHIQTLLGTLDSTPATLHSLIHCCAIITTIIITIIKVLTPQL